MSSSFSPCNDLPRIARKLYSLYLYPEKELKPGEQLIGYYDWGKEKKAFWLWSEQEFELFKREVGKENGIKEVIGYFAVLNNIFYERCKIEDVIIDFNFILIAKGFSREKVKTDVVNAAREHHLAIEVKESKKLMETRYLFNISGKLADKTRFSDWKQEYMKNLYAK